jgi:hypothetical protein
MTVGSSAVRTRIDSSFCSGSQAAVRSGSLGRHARVRDREPLPGLR